MNQADKSSRAAWLETGIQEHAQRFQLDLNRAIRIGRSGDNTIVVVDDLMSRNHAMLQFLDAGYFIITDLGSRNGTSVNGQRITAPRVLRNGDRIKVGNHEFTFRQEEDEAQQPKMDHNELAATNLYSARTLITVLIVDIRDYTVLAQHIDAERLTQIAGAFFREAGKLLHDHGAWGQKYIGDAMMAIWLHKPYGPEPGDIMSLMGAVQKLLTIVDTLQEQFGLDAPIRIGCGINSGWASVGNVGSIAASDYTALGDVVNMAFRLESATRLVNCDLLVGQETLDFLVKYHEAGNCFHQCRVNLKGYEQPVIAWGLQFAELGDVLRSAETAKTVKDSDLTVELPGRSWKSSDSQL